MADIDIVPKKGSSVWLWVVLIVVALALLFWFMSSRTPVPSAQLQEWAPAGVGALDTAGPLAA
jgi:bacteriorhodopsin